MQDPCKLNPQISQQDLKTSWGLRRQALHTCNLYTTIPHLCNGSNDISTCLKVSQLAPAKGAVSTVKNYHI